MNQVVNRYFGLILMGAAFSGLFVPSFGGNTSRVILITLAIIIFASFFRVDMSSLAAREGLAEVAWFWVLRFLLLPIGVFYAFTTFSNFYATCFLLMTLLPAAVSSPAFTAMFGGKVSHTLRILVLSSFLSIITIPPLTGWLLGKAIEIDSRGMFLTMLYTIFIPFVGHLPMRRWKQFSGKISANLPVITASCLSIMFVAATSANKSIIMGNPLKIAHYALLSFVGYAVLYLLGFSVFRRSGRRVHISHSVSSGANNVGLGVALTAVYFSADTNVFFITSQLTWIAILFPMRYVFHWYLSKGVTANNNNTPVTS